MSDPGFEILREDAEILAVVKPAGIATQAARGIDSLEARIKGYLSAIDSPTSPIYLGIPHRLDRPVAGVMVFAKTRRAARQLSRQFERRSVRKRYWACVGGPVEPNCGTWTDYLWKVYGQPRTQVVDGTHPEGQLSVLHYRALGTHRYGSWLEVELETGRTHQIRVQAASRGFPLVGDAHYDSPIPFGQPIEDERLRPIALLARSLTIWHPTTQKEITLEAPPGATWDELQLRQGD